MARWQRDYAARLFLTDLVAVVVAVYGSHSSALVRVTWRWTFQSGYRDVRDRLLLVSPCSSRLDDLAQLFDTRDHKIIGAGSHEYKRITDATIRVFGVLAIIAFLRSRRWARIPADRPPGRLVPYSSSAAGRGGSGSTASAPSGEFLHRALLMGERAKSEHVAQQMKRDGGSGIQIVGAITEHGTTSQELFPGFRCWATTPT